MKYKPITSEQRKRLPIAILDSKIEDIKASWSDEISFDNHEGVAPQRVRSVQWRLGSTLFLFIYREVYDVPGSANIDIRKQRFTGTVRRGWESLPSLGDLEAALRHAKTQRAPKSGDLKAQANKDKHVGETPKNLILEGISGSRAYGLAHEGYTDPESGLWIPPSDVDTRGVFVVPTTEVLSLGRKKELVEQKDDTKYDEIERFLTLCLRSNPERLEMLSFPHKTIVTPEGQLLVDNRHIFLSKLVIHTYGGYARQQLGKIEQKAERRTKPAMHLIRLLLTGIKILEEGVVDCDMSHYRNEMLAIRKGEMPLEEVLKWHQDLEIRFAQAGESTKLPDKPNYKKANEILLEVRDVYRANHRATRAVRRFFYRTTQLLKKG